MAVLTACRIYTKYLVGEHWHPSTCSPFTSTCAMCSAVWTTWTFGKPVSLRGLCDRAVARIRGRRADGRITVGSMSPSTCRYVDTTCANYGGASSYPHRTLKNLGQSDRHKSSTTTRFSVPPQTKDPAERCTTMACRKSKSARVPISGYRPSSEPKMAVSIARRIAQAGGAKTSHQARITHLDPAS